MARSSVTLPMRRKILREYNPDERTIRTLCAIEERLRARNIDPDHIVEGVDA